eukprot:3329728-Rhodomonas_salina.1
MPSHAALTWSAVLPGARGRGDGDPALGKQGRAGADHRCAHTHAHTHAHTACVRAAVAARAVTLPHAHERIGAQCGGFWRRATGGAWRSCCARGPSSALPSSRSPTSQ